MGGEKRLMCGGFVLVGREFGGFADAGFPVEHREREEREREIC